MNAPKQSRRLTPESLDLWWAIPDVLAGMSMPFIHRNRHDQTSAARDAFADELPPLWEAGIRAIVLLLNIPLLEKIYRSAGFTPLLLPIADGAPPRFDQFRLFCQFVNEQRRLKNPVAVHCAAGLGRTGTLIAGYLVTEGAEPRQAIAHVRTVRPGAIETTPQVEFIHSLSNTRPGQR